MSATASAAWDAMYRAQISIMRDLRSAFTNVGMTMNEYDVVSIVHQADGQGIRMRELNANVLITQSSVSRLVDRLVERGLLAKHGDELDARGTIVTLTQNGEDAFERAHEVHQQNIAARMESKLSANELETLAALSKRLISDSSLG